MVDGILSGVLILRPDFARHFKYPGRHSCIILSFIRNDLDLPQKLIKIIIALDAAYVRFAAYLSSACLSRPRRAMKYILQSILVNNDFIYKTMEEMKPFPIG